MNANFLALPTSGCRPLVVQFSDLSTGNPNDWSWNFGNGSFSSLQNPTVVFNNPGTYTVSLTASNASSTDTETKTAYITVFPQPSVAFLAQPNAGCVPFNVQFTDLSTSGGTVTSRIWNFGDGNTSTQQNPANTFSFAGSYNVSLSVTDANGCYATAMVAGMIQAGSVPQAGFTTPDTAACGAPFTVSFSNTTQGGLNNAFLWDFGDGNTSTLPNPSHTYLAPGNYTVGLTVDNPAGCRDTLIRSSLVRISSQSAAFAAAPARVCAGAQVSFQDQSTGGATSWAWDFGDGNQSTLQNPSHSYSAPGLYTVSLVVSTGGGCSDTVAQVNFIEVVAPPVADFSASNLISCQIPFTVNFSDLSTGAAAWYWDFGDGGTSSLQNPSHTYTSAGQFDVRLIVLNPDSCPDTLFRPAYVQVVPPVAAFTHSIVQGNCLPRTVNFIDASTTTLGSIVSWQWNFGDGTSSNVQNPTHTYVFAGQWTVTLIVTTSGACSDTLVLTNLIGTGPDPNANFTASPLSMCYGDSVQFTNSSTNATNFTWDFGDTSTSGLVNPSHVYAQPGCYDVTLIANNYDCPDTLTRANYICVQGVRADFTWNPVFSCDAPATVNFVSVPNLPSLKWQWSLGDGNMAASSSVTHTYNLPGTYLVTMYVEDTVNNCSSSMTHTLVVSRPAAGFTVDTTAGCVPFTVNFTDTTSLAATWAWDFGDGASDTVPSPSHQYTTAGSYDIRLIVAQANGCADTAFFPALITANDIAADFSPASSQVCVGAAISIADLSTSSSPINSWSWTFGDGNSSTTQNPQNTYLAAGLYDVGLTVTNLSGCTDSLMRPAAVEALDPQAAFALSSTNLCPGESLQLSNQSSGSSLSYAWNLGDGNISTLPSPAHSYSANGSYPISLVVTDIAGCADSTTQNMVVSTPAAAFSVSDSVRSCPPLLVNFTSNSTGNIASTVWSFGDGSGSQLANPSYVYTTPGSYDVTLIVTTPTGCADTLVIPQRIDLNGPFAILSLDRDTLCEGDTVTLTAASSNSSYLTWILGDGNVASTNAVVQHSYAGSGAYLPLLVLQDTLGCSVFLSAPDSVHVLANPAVGFTASQLILCDPATVGFSDLTQFSSPPASWNWSFGDGNVSSLPNPSHYYSQPGTYGVSLSVTDSVGCSGSLAMPAMVSVREQNASFALDTTTGCIPLPVNLADNSTADTTITGWQWLFGDGAAGSGSSVGHTYIDTGYFDVQLVITTAAGCMDTLIVPGLVYGFAPANSNAPEMVAASVVNDAQIGLSWQVPAFRGAAGLVLERSTDGVTWLSLAWLAPGTATYLDAAVDVHASSYYYQVGQEDSCGGMSPWSRVGRSILLQVDDQDGTGRLSWNNYTDWAGGVERYEVEAQDADGTGWQILSNLPPTQTSFHDLTLSEAGGGRCYRIRAHELGGNLASSLSNESCGSSDVWVPNTITPNGDGANDLFIIPALGSFPGTAISIYNRWGGLVFESGNYQNDWGGIHQATGEALPDGTYFYVLRLSGREQLIKGYTTIMR